MLVIFISDFCSCAYLPYIRTKIIFYYLIILSNYIYLILLYASFDIVFLQYFVVFSSI